MAKVIENKEWLKNSLMVPHHDLDTLYDERKLYSSAFNKHWDTTPGGNLVMNPPHQFTRTADLKAGAEHATKVNDPSSTKSFGMGRRYSEVIDDNNQVIHMRFGIPQFNSIIGFFNNSFDWTAARLSRTGREPGFLYNIGRVVGFIVSLPIQPLLMIGKAWRFLTNRPATKFYYLKPTMPLYWNAVNSMANELAINMGISPRVFSTKDNMAEGGDTVTNEEMGNYTQGDIIDDYEPVSDDELKAYNDMLPRIFREKGGVDVYAISSRSQRIANESRKRLEKELEKGQEGLRDRIRKYVEENIHGGVLPGQEPTTFPGQDEDEEPGFRAYLSAWQNTNELSKSGAGEDEDNSTREDSTSLWEDISDGWSTLKEFFSAELDDGGQFVSFRVSHTGTTSESFSSSFGESEIAQKLNGTSAQARSKRFSFADGNIFGDEGPMGSLVSGLKNSVMDFAAGALDSIGAGGLMAFAGNSYVSIPQVWQDSSANLPKASYKLELRTPYGDKMSRFLNLYLPLCMILAGGLPKSTGPHTYDAPFLVEIYDKGRKQVRLGMMDSISVSRGVGNIGWTQDHEPLGIDVEFSIVDLETAIHVPINASPSLFDQDTPYIDYLATLGGLSLADQVYQSRKLVANMSKMRDHWKQFASPAKWASMSRGNIAGRALSKIAR